MVTGPLNSLGLTSAEEEVTMIMEENATIVACFFVHTSVTRHSN